MIRRLYVQMSNANTKCEILVTICVLVTNMKIVKYYLRNS